MNAPDVELRPPEGLELPIQGAPYKRPSPELLEEMREVSSATAAAMLHKMGIRQTFIQGPRPRTPGAKVVGSALTLQFMPQREDVASGAAQETSKSRRPCGRSSATCSRETCSASRPTETCTPAAWGRC